MREPARIVACEGGRCVARIERRSVCEKCGRCRFPEGALYLDLELDNRLGAGEGDWVEVEMTGEHARPISAVLCLIPIALAGLAFWLGTLLWEKMIFRLLCCLIGAAIGYIILVIVDGKRKSRKDFVPVMTKIILTGSDNNGKDHSSEGK